MGIIKKISLSYINNTYRTIRVYLPDSYDFSQKRYPVLYMHDGQNLFTDDTSTYGTSWGIMESLQKIECNFESFGLIVVGIDNDSTERYNDYSPWICEKPKSSFDSSIILGGNGDIYADFIVKALKSYIDSNYRTLPDREHTYIAGSSMGGFITAYIAAKYQSVYSIAGVFSIASWFAEQHFLNYMSSINFDNNQKYYLYVGTNETSDSDNTTMPQLYINNTLNYYKKLLLQGVSVDNINLTIGAGESHCEAAWRKYFLEFIEKNIIIV